MSIISHLFTLLIYQPLYNLLIILYNIIPDLGVGIILLTVFTRLLLLPVAKKSIETNKKQMLLQPEMNKIREKYKNDPQTMNTEIWALYKKHNLNPGSGCLPIIIQIIFFIALYRIFRAGVSMEDASNILYGFVKNPGHLNPVAFGFLDLSAKNYILAFAAAALQFWQTKMMAPPKPAADPNKPVEPDFASMMQTQMLYMGPIMTFIIGISFPAALPLYWIVTTLFMVIQQYYVMKNSPNLDKNQKKD